MVLLVVLLTISCTKATSQEDDTASTATPDNALCAQPCVSELDHPEGEAACAEEVEACYEMCDQLLLGTEGDCSACLVSNVVGPEAWEEEGRVLCELGYIYDGDGSDCSAACD
ncbi:MAG: hypothetical protein H6741_24605 [Alphaproteobacteria bacterium]|nr:hypothetical protein [Alphaproteobacteria bacterium]